jgi:hypothetical protein
MKKYTLKEIIEAWAAAYGENMKVEYRGFLKCLKKKQTK